MSVKRRRRTRSKPSTDAMLARIAAINGEAAPVTGRRKFHNTPTVYKGERYDSVGEAEYAWKLDQQVASGKIIAWERPKPVVLLDAPRARDRITYKPDFYVIPADRATPGTPNRDWYTYGYYVDFKGGATETPVFKRNVKMWKARVPYELRVAYRDGTEKIVATGEVAA